MRQHTPCEQCHVDGWTAVIPSTVVMGLPVLNQLKIDCHFHYLELEGNDHLMESMNHWMADVVSTMAYDSVV